MITISAFKWVPEFAQGQVRDLRARLATKRQHVAWVPLASHRTVSAIRCERWIAYLLRWRATSP